MIRGHLFMSAAKRVERKNGQFINKEEEEREREDV